MSVSKTGFVAPVIMLKRRPASKRKAQVELSDSESEGEGAFDVDAAAAQEQNANQDAGFMSLQDLRKLSKGKKPAGDAAASDTAQEQRGVVYLGHIPHGFYEDQMQGFFSQFGDISRLRLSRSKKTGRSRHYAFIQFKEPAVASVVADTMNGYILEGRHLVCKVIAPSRVHDRMFAGADKKFRMIPWRTVAKRRHNAKHDPVTRKKKLEHLMRRDNAKRKQLAAMGIDYEFGGYAGVVESVRASRNSTAAAAAATPSTGKTKSKTKRGKKASAAATEANAEARVAATPASTKRKGKKQRTGPAPGEEVGAGAGAGGGSATGATPAGKAKKATKKKKTKQAAAEAVATPSAPKTRAVPATARPGRSAKKSKGSKKRRKSLA